MIIIVKHECDMILFFAAEMMSPVLLPHHSMHPGSYISGAPIMAPMPHSFPNSEKTELLMKPPYGIYFILYIIIFCICFIVSLFSIQRSL